jgi:hypothetical protein
MVRQPVSSIVLILGLACLPTSACRRDSHPSQDGTSPIARQLIGTWMEDDGQARVYVLANDGTFSMKMTPGRCADAGASETITTSGSWSVQGRNLVLAAKASSDPILQGSVMTDVILELNGATLLVNSSVTTCSGQKLRLARH